MINVTYIDHMGTDLTVANAARVSFGKQSEMDTSDVWGPPKLKDKDAKLISYLANHKHISPFGHCFASFHIKAPVFVARQLVKHKFLRWNEISRRYVDSEPEFYQPTEWRGRSADKKQGSEGVVRVDKVEANTLEDAQTRIGLWAEDNPEKWFERYGREYDPNRDDIYPEFSLLDEIKFFSNEPVDLYNRLLQIGVCPEQARMILPQSMMTEWYWSGSLDAFADMCNLRCKSDTQYETQLVAWDIYYQMKDLFPVSWKALTEELDDER